MGFDGSAKAGSSPCTTTWVTTVAIGGHAEALAEGEGDQAAEVALGHGAQRRQRLWRDHRRRFVLLYAERTRPADRCRGTITTLQPASISSPIDAAMARAFSRCSS